MTSHSSSTSSPGGHRCNNDASDSSSSKIAIHGEGSSVTEQRLGDDEEKLCWRLDQWLFDDNDGDSAAGAMRREELLTAGSPYKKGVSVFVRSD
jgi:hypothetical protein